MAILPISSHSSADDPSLTAGNERPSEQRWLVKVIEKSERNWIKLARITLRPSFSLPITYLAGTRTLLKMTSAVPAAEE